MPASLFQVAVVQYILLKRNNFVPLVLSCFNLHKQACKISSLNLHKILHSLLGCSYMANWLDVRPVVTTVDFGLDTVLLFGAAMLAGGINVIAGGGGLIIFPALLLVGVLP